MPTDDTYRRLPLVEVVSRIVHDGDRMALSEFHTHRTLFSSGAGVRVVFMPYLQDVFCQAWVRRLCNLRDDVLETALDEAQARFVMLPAEASAGSPSRNGHDCRRYFRFLLRLMSQWRSEHPEADRLQEEEMGARITKSVVDLQIPRACREALRRLDRTRSRHSFNCNGRTITVYMPTCKSGHKRREWLEQNMAHLGQDSAVGRHELQQAINRSLGHARCVPLTPTIGEHISLRAYRSRSECPIGDDQGGTRLIDIIADEKAERINQQRPTIQNLGPQRLRALVQRILEAIVDGDYVQAEVAREWGLDKATMNRFARVRWESGTTIPDLYANIAETIASNTDLVEAARETGVWHRVEAVFQAAAIHRRQRHAE